MAFMRAVNPCVDWTDLQWRLIVDEACFSSRYCCATAISHVMLSMMQVSLPFSL